MECIKNVKQLNFTFGEIVFLIFFKNYFFMMSVYCFYFFIKSGKTERGVFRHPPKIPNIRQKGYFWVYKRLWEWSV